MVPIAPPSDRRARLAVVLALLGIPSIGVTLPATVWLGASALRQQRLASGAEPVMGFLALVIAGLDLLFVDQAIRGLFGSVPLDAALISLGWGVMLSVVVVVLAASVLRIHPERSGALLATRAGLVASLGGGGAMFVRLLVTINS